MEKLLALVNLAMVMANTGMSKDEAILTILAENYIGENSEFDMIDAAINHNNSKIARSKEIKDGFNKKNYRDSMAKSLGFNNVKKGSNNHSVFDHNDTERIYNRNSKKYNAVIDVDSNYETPEFNSYDAWKDCIDEYAPLHIGGNGQRFFKVGNTFLVLDAWQLEDGTWYKTIEQTTREEVIKCYNADIVADVANFARRKGVTIKAADLELPDWLQ